VGASFIFLFLFSHRKILGSSQLLLWLYSSVSLSSSVFLKDFLGLFSWSSSSLTTGVSSLSDFLSIFSFYFLFIHIHFIFFYYSLPLSTSFPSILPPFIHHLSYYLSVSFLFFYFFIFILFFDFIYFVLFCFISLYPYSFHFFYYSLLLYFFLTHKKLFKSTKKN
jgi:hypothetical protein